MFFSRTKDLNFYIIPSVPFSNLTSKVLIQTKLGIEVGYLFPLSNQIDNAIVLEDCKILKLYVTKQIPLKYIKLYKYISDKYIYPFANILDIVFNNQSFKTKSVFLKDFYIKTDIITIMESTYNNYEDISNFILQNKDLKYSYLIRHFSKRRIKNFLAKIPYSEYQKGIKALGRISLRKLIKIIDEIADSHLRLFIFPSASLKDEVYESLSYKYNVFNETSIKDIIKFDTKKFNIYFGSPLTLLFPFEWDEIILVDSDSDLYKINYPPYFDTLEILKDFFSDKLKLHYRSPTFMLYKFFGIDININQSNIAFSKIDNSLKDLIEHSLSRGKRVLFLTNHIGYASKVKCANCGVIQRCPNCLKPLTYYHDQKIYSCNYCGYTSKDLKCSNCNSTFFEYFSFGTQYFKDKFLSLSPSVSLFDKNNRNLDNINSQFLIATTSIFYHLVLKHFDLIVLSNIDDFVFMDYAARDRILTLILKLQTLVNDNGKIVVFYRNNLFNLRSPIDLQYYYTNEDLDRNNFNFPPYYDIIYVVFDTSRLKLDYLFGKLTLYLREYCTEDYEIYKREQFSKGILTIKIKESKMLKPFFNKYINQINIYVNSRKDIG